MHSADPESNSQDILNSGDGIWRFFHEVHNPLFLRQCHGLTMDKVLNCKKTDKGLREDSWTTSLKPK